LKSFIYIVLAAAVLMVVAGCSSPEARLVGKWVGQTGSIEFFKDKTGVINPPKEQTDLPPIVQFKWKIEQKDNVRMDIAVNGGKTSVARFEGNKVLIVEDDRFTKVK
jgi:hypothetical protein